MQRLNDLVFVKYNQALKARYDSKDTIDPISLNDIDESNEWLIGKVDAGGIEEAIEDEDAEDDVVFSDDEGGLTWGAVARAMGVGEPNRITRKHVKSAPTPNVGSSSRVVQDDEESEEESYETEEGDALDDDGYSSDGGFDDTS